MDRYEEALERAKKGLPLDEVFPELKESEDERIRKSIILLLQRGGYMSPEDKTKAFAWLEKHKEQKQTSNTVGCMNCTKWEKCKGGLTTCSGWMLKTEEQKHVECIEFDNEFKNQISHLFASILNKEWKYDKNFVEYVAQQLLEYAKYEIKPKQEWSEEDKQTIRDTINRIEQLDHYWNRPTDEKLIKRLKSLRPQPHWKPSEEQIKALERAIVKMHKPNDISILAELRDNLKKLQL